MGTIRPEQSPGSRDPPSPRSTRHSERDHQSGAHPQGPRVPADRVDGQEDDTQLVQHRQHEEAASSNASQTDDNRRQRQDDQINPWQGDGRGLRPPQPTFDPWSETSDDGIREGTTDLYCIIVHLLSLRLLYLIKLLCCKDIKMHHTPAGAAFCVMNFNATAGYTRKRETCLFSSSAESAILAEAM